MLAVIRLVGLRNEGKKIKKIMCGINKNNLESNVEIGDVNKNNCYSYDEAVELTGHGRYNYMLLAACSIISNAVALDMFGFGVIVAASTCDLQLTMQQKGILSSIPFAGLLTAYAWGYYTDLYGRRRALMWSTSVGFLFAALSSFSWRWYILAVFKLLGSSFSTAAFSITMTLLGECTPSAYRSQFLFIMNSINLASETVSFLLAYFVLPLNIEFLIPYLGITFRAWRLLNLLMALPLGFGAIMMLFFYESPKFLASRGKDTEALAVLQGIYKTNGGVQEEFKVKSLISEWKREQEDVSFCASLTRQTAPIFKTPLLYKTLQLFYLMILVCSTNNVFAIWFPTIVNSFFGSLSSAPDQTQTMSFCQRVNDNLTMITEETTSTTYYCNDLISNNTIYSGIAYGLFFTLANLFIAKLACWRRVVFISTLALSAVSCVLLNLVHNPVSNMIFFILLQVTSICIGLVMSYIVDMFPTTCRGLVSSLAVMAARAGSFVGVNIIGAVIAEHCTSTFYYWAVYVLSGIWVAVYLPSDRITKTAL